MVRPVKRYSVQEKRAACTAYLILGSFRKAGDEVGISDKTVALWAKTDWWNAWEEQITEQLGKQLVAKMRGVVHESYDQLADRLANGDVHVTSSGETVRHPIKAKDLSIIGNVGSDKIRLGEGKATSRTERVGTLDDLAAQFEKIAQRYGANIKDMGELKPIIEGERAMPQSALPGDKR